MGQIIKLGSVLTCSPKFWSRGGTQRSSLCAHGETRFQLHTHLAWLALASPPRNSHLRLLRGEFFFFLLSSINTLKVSTQGGNYL